MGAPAEGSAEGTVTPLGRTGLGYSVAARTATEVLRPTRGARLGAEKVLPELRTAKALEEAEAIADILAIEVGGKTNKVKYANK